MLCAIKSVSAKGLQNRLDELVSIRKTDVAVEYLTDALEHYKNKHFYSALTLGGAAEEILGKAIKYSPEKFAAIALPRQHALDAEISDRAHGDNMFGSPKRTNTEITRAINFPKNSAKHFGDENEDALAFDDPVIEAGEVLLRAITNYRMVHPGLPHQFQWEEEEIKVYRLNQGSFGRGHNK